MDNKRKLQVLGNRFGKKTIIELRTITGAFQYDYISLLGRNSINDGFACSFYWDKNHSGQDDGVNIIKPNTVAGNGRWLLVKVPTGSGGGNDTPRTKTESFEYSYKKFDTTISNPFGHTNMIIQLYETVSGPTINYLLVDANIRVRPASIEINVSRAFKLNVEYKLQLVEIIT